jgi:5'-phosphate synthase pdxT subunit
MVNTFTVGILGLQGDFKEHQNMIERLGAKSIVVKHISQLDSIDGLIIPGGESTAIAKLTEDAAVDIFEAMHNKILAGMPVYGTCMGSIFLAKDIEGSCQGRLALMDITVKRNAFGPQKFSREQEIVIPILGPEPFPAVFIRAPIITSCKSSVVILARINEGIIMARQNNMLITSFHPEITDDMRVHQYFLSMLESNKLTNFSEFVYLNRS